jgi:hypothetical protein
MNWTKQLKRVWGRRRISADGRTFIFRMRRGLAIRRNEIKSEKLLALRAHFFSDRSVPVDGHFDREEHLPKKFHVSKSREIIHRYHQHGIRDPCFMRYINNRDIITPFREATGWTLPLIADG